MQTKTNVTAEGQMTNLSSVVALKLKTTVKAGFKGCCDWGDPNHNQTAATALKLKTTIKAGYKACCDWGSPNHNQTPA